MSDAPQTVPSAPGKRRKPLDLPGILARRAGFVAIASALLALLTVPLAQRSGSQTFRTEGYLLINPGKEPTLTGRERETIPGNVGDYARTLLNRLTAGDVLRAAIAGLPPEQRPALLRTTQSPEAQIGRLFKALKVTEVPRTYLLRVELASDAPEGLAPALNAVLDAFLDKLRLEMEQQYTQRLAYLHAEQIQIVARIADERARLLALAATVSNKAFLHENYSVHLAKLEQIQRLYWEAEAQRAEREGDWRRAAANRRDLPTLSLQAYADERVADNFGINRIEQWTYEQLQSLRSTIDGLTTNNGDRTYVEARMAAMNNYLDSYKLQVNDLAIRVLSDKRAYDLDAEAIRASNALAGAACASDFLQARLTEAQREATATSEAIFRSSEPFFSVNQLRERLTALNSRIDDCEMEAKAPLHLSIDRRAQDPARPAADSRGRLGLLGLLAALVIVLAGVLLFEWLDDRVRGPAEVAAAAGGPVTDAVPFLLEGGIERVLLDQPRSAAAAAYLGLATRLNRERVKHEARLFAFCGAGAGVGNSAAALNGAQALARHAPRVCLLRLDGHGGAPAATAALLRDPQGCEAAILRDEARGVDLLTLAVPREGRVAWSGWPALRGRLCQAYDALIVDLGPVPGDDLALAVLDSADAAVVTALEDVTLYRDLRRAVDSVTAAGVASFTLLLNGSRRPPGGRLHRGLQRVLSVVSRQHRRLVLESARRWAAWRGRRGGGKAA